MADVFDFSASNARDSKGALAGMACGQILFTHGGGGCPTIMYLGARLFGLGKRLEGCGRISQSLVQIDALVYG